MLRSLSAPTLATILAATGLSPAFAGANVSVGHIYFGQVSGARNAPPVTIASPVTGPYGPKFKLETDEAGCPTKKTRSGAGGHNRSRYRAVSGAETVVQGCGWRHHESWLRTKTPSRSAVIETA
jgi:hypothetical protein